MRVIDRLSMAQRIVVVIALGVAFTVLGRYLVSLGGHPPFGWYGYSPLDARVGPVSSGLAPWLRVIVWLALTAGWAGSSIRVLRPARGEAG